MIAKIYEILDDWKPIKNDSWISFVFIFILRITLLGNYSIKIVHASFL